jgi:GTP diphosphokinase / guanosine-3',5'-bis(diphosphate) 3'-diphosphatase
MLDIQASRPTDWSAERKQAYFDWADNVIAGLRDVHPGL